MGLGGLGGLGARLLVSPVMRQSLANGSSVFSPPLPNLSYSGFVVAPALVFTFIADGEGGTVPRSVVPTPSFSLLSPPHLSSQLPYPLATISSSSHPLAFLSQMTSLIEGWFEPINAQPYVNNSPDKKASSRKDKSYLTVYDACAALGSLSSGNFVDCEIRLWPGNQILEQKIIHAHGRFSIITAPGDDDPCLQIEVYRFVVMHADDSSPDPTPLEVRTSVTLCGQVTSTADAANDGSADKFFTLAVSEYIRDHIQSFHIRSDPFLLSPSCR